MNGFSDSLSSLNSAMVYTSGSTGNSVSSRNLPYTIKKSLAKVPYDEQIYVTALMKFAPGNRTVEIYFFYGKNLPEAVGKRPYFVKKFFAAFNINSAEFMHFSASSFS